MIAKKVGNFGIILTRRYLLYMAAVIGVILSIYMFILVEEKAHSTRKFKPPSVINLFVFFIG